MLPAATREPLLHRMEWRSALHAADIANGQGRVDMPTALKLKFPNADHDLAWQFVFASTKLSKCPCTGAVGRHHVHEAAVTRAVTFAVRGLGWSKRSTCHTLRMASAYCYTLLRMAYSQGNSPWSGDVLASWRP